MTRTIVNGRENQTMPKLDMGRIRVVQRSLRRTCSILSRIFKLRRCCRHLGYLKLLYSMLILTGVIYCLSRFQNLNKLTRFSLSLIPELSNNTAKAHDATWKKGVNVRSQSDNSAMIILHNNDSLEEPHEHRVGGWENSPNEIVMTEKSCQPHTHIFFLKTHKTASSTIMNILFRFGESRNLTFALPMYNNSQFFYPSYFNADYVEGFSKKTYHHYDIMCHHMRFLQPQVEKVMLKDTFYFTILRNPVSLMESSFSYYKSLEVFKKAFSLEEFLKHPHKYYNKSSKFSNYGRNLMTFDLGFHQDGRVTPKRIRLTRQAVETTFNLVLITEYFDESLVLLKDALCWSFDDVLSFPLNSRSSTSRKALSLETQERIKSWNQLDWQLYIYFNSSFWEQVDTFGRDRMQREIQELQRRRAKQSEICLQGQVDPNDMKDKSLQPFQAGLARILGYNLKSGLGEAERSLCQRLVTPELQYTQLLHKSTKHKFRIFGHSLNQPVH